MTNQIPVFEALQRIARERSLQSQEQCPEVLAALDFPDRVCESVLEHIAFCPVCRQRMIAAHCRAAIPDEDRTPDWDRLLRRLLSSAHWILIKERILSLTRLPLDIFPEISTAPVRLAEPASAAITLTIFEINLTAQPRLSDPGLRITRMELQPETKQFNLEISGFNPTLAGAESRLGLARREVFLSACGYRTMTNDWDLSRIEEQLQKGFQRPNGPPERFKRLIRDTAWFEGKVEASGSDYRLIVTCPDILTSLFFRKDIWSMLLVSRP